MDFALKRLTLLFSITFLAIASPPAGTAHLPGREAPSPGELGYQYLSPLPGARYVTTAPRIIIRRGEILEDSSPPRPGDIALHGSESGRHWASCILSTDGKTLVYTPDRPFHPGETVRVSWNPSVRTAGGDPLPPCEYTFTIERKLLPESEERRLLRERFVSGWAGEPSGSSTSHKRGESAEPLPRHELDAGPVAVPDGLFDYNIDVNEPEAAGGYVYISPYISPGELMISYNLVLRNDGTVVYYTAHEHGSIAWDFKPHPEIDRISYFLYPQRECYVLDTTYTLAETITASEGYHIDLHDILLLENGHAVFASMDLVVMDMSEIVEGGQEEAVVVCMIIEELDADRNPVLQWRSLDHIPVTDADSTIDLTSSHIDYMHTNSVEVDHDDHLVISSRHISEITKINRYTGYMIWRLGGGAGNQFEFMEDDNAFTWQHDARRLDNGNLLLFDNANLSRPRISSVKEYLLDEEALEATLVWSYAQDPASFSYSQGSSRRLANGNTIIGWGLPSNYIMASEVDRDGETVWQVSFPDVNGERVNVYRAYRTGLIGRAARPYLAGEGEGGEITLYCNHFGRENIDSYQIFMDTRPEPTELREVIEESEYRVTGLEIGETCYFRIKSVTSGGTVSDFSNQLEYVPEESGIAAEGAAGPGQHTIAEVHPNPFNDRAKVTVRLDRPGVLTFRVFDLLGRTVLSRKAGRCDPGRRTFTFNARSLASGVYFLRVSVNRKASRPVKLLLLR